MKMPTNHIIAVLGLISFIGFGVVPLRNHSQNLEVTNVKLYKKKQKQMKELERLEEIAAAGSQENQIPNSPEELALADDLNAMAKSAGVVLPANWDFKINKNSDIGSEQISVSFPIQGRRQQIANFLGAIEKNERFLGVKSFDIRTEETENLYLTKMDVDVYGFFLSEK